MTDDLVLVSVSMSDLARQRLIRPGQANPEEIDNPFFLAMIRSRLPASAVSRHAEQDLERFRRCGVGMAWREDPCGPFFSFRRYGRTVTPLNDGRVVWIGGTHEDFYDPDFCIYNDVVVESQDGSLDHYIYPYDVFPPTDQHSATLCGDRLYLIGNLGYRDRRDPGMTPVVALDCRSMSMERLETWSGPGWISGHAASYDPHSHTILLEGGSVWTGESLTPNGARWSLDLGTRLWSAAGD